MDNFSVSHFCFVLILVVIMLWFDWMISGVFSFYVLYVLSLLIFHIHIDCLSVYPSLLCQHIFHC